MRQLKNILCRECILLWWLTHVGSQSWVAGLDVGCITDIWFFGHFVTHLHHYVWNDPLVLALTVVPHLCIWPALRWPVLIKGLLFTETHVPADAVSDLIAGILLNRCRTAGILLNRCRTSGVGVPHSHKFRIYGHSLSFTKTWVLQKNNVGLVGMNYLCSALFEHTCA